MAVCEVKPLTRHPISVLLASFSYWPVLGGSETEAQRVCGGLVKRGHSVRVFCAALGPMPKQRNWRDPCDVPVRICGTGVRRRWLDHVFAIELAAHLILNRNRYHLVYFLMPGLHVAVCLPIAKLLRIPILMKFACSGHITTASRSWLGRLELRWLAKWAYRVMVLNDGMVEEARAAGLNSGHLLWMPNPVDVRTFTPCTGNEKKVIRGNLGVSEEALVVVFTGRLAAEKDLVTLLSAFARIHGEFSNAMLVLVGEGPQRSLLEACASEWGVESTVRFTGRLDVPELLQWLQASDIFALVSFEEGFSCSLIEAMACQLPSIVSDIPANLQLVTSGESGLVVEQGSRDSVSAAILKLFRDPNLRIRMGIAAREKVVQHYSTDAILDRYEKLFQETVFANS